MWFQLTRNHVIFICPCCNCKLQNKHHVAETGLENMAIGETVDVSKEIQRLATQKRIGGRSMDKNLFSLKEIEEAIEAAKDMVLDANIDEGTKIIQMGGCILRHLNETPEKNSESTILVHKKGKGISMEETER